MSTLEALAFGLNDLSHVLLPLALPDLGYGRLGPGFLTLAMDALVLDLSKFSLVNTGVVDIVLASS